MKKIYFTLITTAALFAMKSHAQTISTFEDNLFPNDSFVNGNNFSGGFSSGNAFFVNHYDTSFGGSWDGFSISSKKDTVTIGYGNQYAAITGAGYSNSANYAVGYGNAFGIPARIRLTGAANGKQLSGFYVTNSTFAYRDMQNGSAFSKKFGGATGNDPDWYKISILGYKNGGAADSTIEVYMADFRDSDNGKDYILNTWKWIDLQPMGDVDSIEFAFASSDTGAFGMNTPTYFCLDNFTTMDIFTTVKEQVQANEISLWPNPAKDFVHISVQGKATHVSIRDLSQRVVMNGMLANDGSVDIAALPRGMYIIQVDTEAGSILKKLVKE